MKLSRYFLLFILFDMANFLCKTCETSLENKEDCALHEEAHRREGVKAEIRVVCKDCFREYSSVKNYRGERETKKQGRIHGIRCYETPFSAVEEKAYGRTDGLTDGRTVGRKDGPSYRGAS